jgi:hypothetical protein
MEKRLATSITTNNCIILLVSFLLGGAACTNKNEVTNNAQFKIISTCEYCTESFMDSLKKEIWTNKNDLAYLEYVACHSLLRRDTDSISEITIYLAELGNGNASLYLAKYYLSLDSTTFLTLKKSDELIANFDSLGLVKQKKVIQYLTQAVEQNVMFSEMYEVLLHR